MQIPSSTRYHATFTENNKTHINPDRRLGQMLCHMRWNYSPKKGRSPRRTSVLRWRWIAWWREQPLPRRDFSTPLAPPLNGLFSPLPELHSEPNSLLTLCALRRNHIYWTFLARTAHPCSSDADEGDIVEPGPPSSSLLLTLLDILPPIFSGVHLSFFKDPWCPQLVPIQISKHLSKNSHKC